MKMSNPVIRPATEADMKAYFPDVKLPTARAWVGELNGEIAVVGGFAFREDRWYVFFDAKPISKDYPLAIALTSKRIIKKADEGGIKRLYASCDRNEETAVGWLEYLGFKPSGMNPDLYVRGEL
jgi:hypothetical protein